MINTERLTIHLENKILERHAGASVHALVAEGVDRVGNELAELWKLRAQSTVSTWTIDPQRLVEQDWICLLYTSVGTS